LQWNDLVFHFNEPLLALMTFYSPSSRFVRYVTLMLLGVSSAVWIASAHAQTPTPTAAKILVLTTDEGQPGDTKAFAADGKEASDNLAAAFGYGTPLISPAPQVTYLYGALSIRALKSTDRAVSPPNANTALYPSTPTDTVRVVHSANTEVDPATFLTTGTPANPEGKEDVVYVPDGRKRLDANDLASTFTAPGGGRYDLVVVGTTYRKATDEAYLALAKLMQDPQLKPNAILFFVDSCCDSSASIAWNVARFSGLVLEKATASVAHDIKAVGGDNGQKVDTSLNPSSPYATSFTSLLPSIRGGHFTNMTGVPKDNVLFGTVPTTTSASAYGAFFPATQVFNGPGESGGTCLFSVIDITPFDMNPGNFLPYQFNTGGIDVKVSPPQPSHHNLGQAFVNAAMNGGSCGGMASISATPPEQAVTLGAPTATITLTVKNETLPVGSGAPAGAGSISGGRVQSPLPSHLVFDTDHTQPIETTCTLGTDPATAGPGQVTTTASGFSVTGITIPNQGSCTITLHVKWDDTSDLATNACMRDAQKTTKLEILPGTSQQFSTTQGQTHDIASALVHCSVPELALSVLTPLAPSYAGGSPVTYDVAITNLSETASAASAMLSGLAPAGVTPTVTLLAGAHPACVSESNCTLAPGESANFTVTFTAPTTAAGMAFTPTVALPNESAARHSEVTFDNNTAALSATLTRQLLVQARLNTSGAGDFSTLAGTPMSFTAANCSAAQPAGNAPLGINAPGVAVLTTAAGGAACDVTFTNAPGALPPGYQLTSPTPVLSSVTDPATGNQTVVAVWDVIAPVVLSVSGSVVGAPSTFPAELVGQSVSLQLNCAPTAAQPDAVTLTIDATGQLATTTQPVVNGAALCTPTLAETVPSLPLPPGYEWKASSISPSAGNSHFVVTLRMAPRSVTPTSATAVPTLGEWAVYALSALMLLAAARVTRARGAKHTD